jgi:hypothetical protein
MSGRTKLQVDHVEVQESLLALRSLVETAKSLRSDLHEFEAASQRRHNELLVVQLRLLEALRDAPQRDRQEVERVRLLGLMREIEADAALRSESRGERGQNGQARNGEVHREPVR